MRGLHRGLNVSIFKMFLYRASYFGFYDHVKKNFLKSSDSTAANGLKSFTLAYFVTIFSSAIAYPFDTVNKRIIMTAGQRFHYDSTLHCMRLIWQKEGLPNLFRGFSVFALRSLSGAAILALYDKS